MEEVDGVCVRGAELSHSLSTHLSTSSSSRNPVCCIVNYRKITLCSCSQKPHKLRMCSYASITKCPSFTPSFSVGFLLVLSVLMFLLNGESVLTECIVKTLAYLDYFSCTVEGRTQKIHYRWATSPTLLPPTPTDRVTSSRPAVAGPVYSCYFPYTLHCK